MTTVHHNTQNTIVDLVNDTPFTSPQQIIDQLVEKWDDEHQDFDYTQDYQDSWDKEFHAQMEMEEEIEMEISNTLRARRLSNPYQETRREFIERFLAEGDEEWAKYCKEQERLRIDALRRKKEAQARAPKPTEAEMQKALQEFMSEYRRERENEIEKMWKHRISLIAEWVESHPTTRVEDGTYLEDQWEIYCRECKDEEDRLRKEQAKKDFIASQKMLRKNERAKAKNRARPSINNQAQRKKEEEAKKKAKKEAEIASAKEQGTYLGKRALRKQKKVEIVPIEKPLEEQPEIEEEEVEKESEEYIPVLVAENDRVYMPEKPKVQPKPKPVKEESEDDFVAGMLAAQEKVAGKASGKVEKPKPKPKKGKQKIELQLEESWTMAKNRKKRERKEKRTPKPSLPPQPQTRTKMCESIRRVGKCRHGERCRFAHSLKELNIRDCRFGDECKFGKACAWRHSNESDEEYFARQGYTPVSTPASSTASSPRVRLTTRPITRIAPWAKKPDTRNPDTRKIVKVAKKDFAKALAKIKASGMTKKIKLVAI